jgi:hypothetical protein
MHTTWRVISGSAVLCLMAACSAPTTPSADAPTVATTAAAVPTSGSPSPSQSRSAAAEFKILASGYLKGKEVGKGWTGGTPKDYLAETLSKTKPAEACPGHETDLYKAISGQVGEAGNQYKSDSGYVGIDISTFPAPADPARFSTGLASDLEACKEFAYKGNDGTVYYYTNTPDTAPVKLAHGQSVGGYTQKVYSDKKHKKLSYTIYRVNAVTNRGLVRIYLTGYPNTRATYDMKYTSKVLDAQLDKLDKALGTS